MPFTPEQRAAGAAALREACRRKADARVAAIAPVIAEIQAIGITTLVGIARVLTAEGHRRPRGGAWTSQAVADALDRLPGQRVRLTHAQVCAAWKEGSIAAGLERRFNTLGALITEARRLRRAGLPVTRRNVAEGAGRGERTATRYWAQVCEAVPPEKRARGPRRRPAAIQAAF